jgi:hypothetical protein
MAVWSPHSAYLKRIPQWKRARDAVGGLDTVRGNTETYLPRLKDQDETDYHAYLTRASWFGASAQVTTGLLGMLWRRPPRQVLPAGIAKMADDIDMAGTPLNVFASQCTDEILTVGRVGILVDHPPSIDLDGIPITLANQESLGLRPTLQMYNTEMILNWRHRRVKNAWALSMVVLEEMYEAPSDAWDNSSEPRWRVLDLDPADQYRQRVYRKPRADEPALPTEIQVGPDIYPLIDGKTLDFIPFYCAGIDDLDIDPDEPPLINLYDINYSHYRVTADYENGCHFTGLPTPYIAGYTTEANEDGKAPERLFVGSSYAWIFPDPATKVGYLEFHGTGLKSLQENLDRKELQMAIVGSRMLMADNKGRSNESATAATVHRVGESSKMSSIAENISIAFERALKVFANWANAAGDVQYQLNRDFVPVVMDALTLTALTAALEAGKISFDTYWDMLQRGDIGDLDITAEMEKARIKLNPPPVVPPTPKGPASVTQNAPDKVAAGSAPAGGAQT